MNWPELITAAQNFYEATELGRIIASGVTIGVGVVLAKVWERRLRKQAEQAEQAELDHQVLDIARQKFVTAKNVIWVTVAFIVFTIWASKIAGIILSLAAVAGASLIVSKELIMCLLGYGYLTSSRAIRVGDFIDVNGMKGKVVDIEMMATTLAETSLANQQTGRTLTLPNSVWLSHPVRNVSATGESVINALQLILPIEVDIELAEKVALEAAQTIAGQWQGAINRHLAKHELRNLVDMPSARPKILWIPLDAKSHALVIRYGCPLNQRVNSEQGIFRHFWKNYNEESKRLKACVPASSVALPVVEAKIGVPDGLQTLGAQD